MKKKLDIITSFALYGFGLLSFLIADIFVSENFGREQTANWAFYKSTLLIIGSVLLLGYDQVFVRDPSLIKRFFVKFLFQAISIASVSIFVISYLKEYSVTKGLLLFLSTLSVGFLNYSSASHRANYNLWKAQFSTNFWKILLLIFLFFELFEFSLFYFTIPLLISFVIAICIGGYTNKEDKTLFENLSDNDSRAIANAFLFTNLTLILSIHGEQFLINLNKDNIASAHLFKHFAVFTPIALSINGFLGFYLAPKIRREKQMTLAKYKSLSLKVSLLAAAITGFSILSGYIYLSYFSKQNIFTPDWFLIVSLTLLCLIRGFYTATSVCLGVFADKKKLKTVAVLFWASAGIFIIGVFLTLSITSGIKAAQIISVLSAFNWLTRLIISNFYTHKILKELNSVKS